ncbi:MAG: redox-sensing transcriptional repressor Rex [Clostridiales bacterium]|nr:redox-sensing transcriptional repressor Rex [Clostridiales bacterium]
MKSREVPRATIGRIPAYLKYLKALPPDVQSISAPIIAKELGLGEVQVRKDLNAVSGAGKPKIGYDAAELTKSLEAFLGRENGGAVIVGAGKLGRALLDYGGFAEYGLSLLAAFDSGLQKEEKSETGKSIFPMELFTSFCKENDVKIGIIAVPAAAAQGVCDQFVQNHIQAIWNFAPCVLRAPSEIAVQYENMALSLAHLKAQIKNSKQII